MICKNCTVDDALDGSMCFQCVAVLQVENTVKMLERTREVLLMIEDTYGYETYARYTETLESMLSKEALEYWFPEGLTF